MAEVSETLTYRFQAENLGDVRRSLKRLSGDVEDLGDEFSELGAEAEGGAEAAEEAVKDLKRTVARIDFGEIGDEAMDAADEVALAASVMEEELEGVQEALDDISTLGARRQMRRLGREIENVLLRTQALDAQDIDIDADVNQDLSGAAASRAVSGGGGGGRSFRDQLTTDQSLAQNLNRLNDEVFAAASIFGSVSTKAKVLVGGLGAAGAALVALAGSAAALDAAAVALASKIGDTDLQRSITSVKVAFTDVARDFVDAFEPLIENEILPAGRVFAGALRGLTPGLKALASVFTPQLIQGVAKGLTALQFFSSFATGRLPEFIARTSPLGPDIQQPFMTRDQGVQFGQDRDRFEGLTAEAQESMQEIIREIGRARFKFRNDLIPEQELRQQLADLRVEGVETLRKVEQKTGDNVEQLDRWVQMAQEAKRALERLEAGEVPSLGSFAIAGLSRPDSLPRQDVDTASPSQMLSGTLGSIRERIGDLRESGLLSPLQAARKEVAAIENKIRSALKGGFEPASQKVQTLKDQLAEARAELQQMQTKAAGVGQALQQAAVRGLSRLTSGIGRAVGSALFSDPRRVNRLEERRRRIQQNLRQARQAGNFQQVRQLQKDLTKVNKKLKQTKSLFGRIGQAFKSFGNIAKRVLQQVIAKLISAATLALALAPFTGGLSSFGGNFTTILGGGIPELDSGGRILSDGIAKVHEGEAVIPADVTRSLEALVQPAQPTAQPAAMAGAGGVNLTVQVEGESRIENGHIKKAYDTAAQVEQRVGRRGR